MLRMSDVSKVFEADDICILLMDIPDLSGGDSEKKNGYPHLDSEVSLFIVT